MSHSSGTIKRTDGTVIGYFEYNGTVDMSLPTIYDTLDEVEKNWRQRGFEKQCDCTEDLTDVCLEIAFSGSFDSKVCEKHKCIAAGHCYAYETEDV